MSNIYDVVIIGAGVGGMTTALYTARANLKTLVIEKGIYGGQLNNTAEIENYSGFASISGANLSQNMYHQAFVQHGAEYTYGNVIGIDRYNDVFEIYVENQEGAILTKSVVIATGVEHRKLGVEGEERLSGRGVSYCAICDGAFFKDKDVVVIGGGDSALEEANYLTQFVKGVTIIHRRDMFRGQAVLQDRVFKNPKIRTFMNCNVKEIIGDTKVKEIFVEDNMMGIKGSFILPTDGVFIYVGANPITDNFKGIVKMDERGYIVTDESMMTSTDGIFAIGDVRSKEIRQVATAVGDGAIAGVNVSKYLETL